MSKETIKQQIAKLVEKYNKVKADGKINSYNEANTRNEFIEPLFGFLGWDMRNSEHEHEVTSEETISRERVDLAFRINGIAKFFLEAKSLKTDLNIESYARQAINYSWNKGASWAVLTDFESIKVYNALTLSKNLLDKLVFEITWEEYLSDFDRLWLLSKESFENNELDKYAEKYGKKLKKLTVNDKLYGDLKEARDVLTRSFGRWNDTVDQETLDEGIQRILDRLVFIRVLEDKGLEENILKQTLNDWQGKKDKQLFDLMKDKFVELDKIYDSNIFKIHACDKWQEYDGKLEEVINSLYGNNVYEYDFKSIPSDILGGVYEGYLSYISQNPIKIDVNGKFGKLLNIEDKGENKLKSRQKRKEHGIYYTPKFIVDYIVENTLGEKLKEITSIHGLKKLKVLDPACGSGSFLNKALEVINNKYKEFGNAGGQLTKAEILLENIHGVDLDPQAIELAKLNLLIETLDKKAKLPDLTNNIRVGNSLISGTEEELKKYFGENWRDKRPFDWHKEFKEVFDQGGFDVIIGNPPYIRVDSIDCSQKLLWKNTFTSCSGKYDIYYLFIERSLMLLKEGGILGFIIPNKYCVADSAQKLREVIFNYSSKSNFFSVSRIDVFKDASNYPLIMILEKGVDSKNVNLGYAETEQEVINNNFYKFNIKNDLYNLLPNKIIPINVKKEQLDLCCNIILKSKNKLNKYLKISEGLRIPPIYEINTDSDYSITKQYQFKRYSQISDGSFINKQNLNKVIGVTSNRFKNCIKDKILISEDALFITATIDDKKSIPQGGVYFATLINKNDDLNFFLSLLNSKLFSFMYKTLFSGMHMGGGYLRYRTSFLEELPITNFNSNDIIVISDLSKKILNLNKFKEEAIEDTNKMSEIKKEIEKTDKEINQKVYELYGLTEDEIEIVEGN